MSPVGVKDDAEAPAAGNRLIAAAEAPLAGVAAPDAGFAPDAGVGPEAVPGPFDDEGLAAGVELPPPPPQADMKTESAAAAIAERWMIIFIFASSWRATSADLVPEMMFRVIKIDLWRRYINVTRYFLGHERRENIASRRFFVTQGERHEIRERGARGHC